MDGLGLRRLASLAAPPRCAACAFACEEGGPLCGSCADELRSATPIVEAGPPGVDLAVAASRFEGVARRLVHGLKFARRLGLAQIAAEAMLRSSPDPGCSAVVAVPAAPWRAGWRGFDPAEELAIALAERSGLPLRGCLRRSRGPRQVGRSRRARLADPPSVRARPPVPEATLLVDDVWTTGATLSACAAALRSSGCRRVVALTLARAL
jgi:predicted amidophosphoribosyltransferase